MDCVWVFRLAGWTQRIPGEHASVTADNDKVILDRYHTDLSIDDRTPSSNIDKLVVRVWIIYNDRTIVGSDDNSVSIDTRHLRCEVYAQEVGGLEVLRNGYVEEIERLLDCVKAPVSEIGVISDNDEGDVSTVDVGVNLDLVRTIVTNRGLVADQSCVDIPKCE